MIEISEKSREDFPVFAFFRYLLDVVKRVCQIATIYYVPSIIQYFYKIFNINFKFKVKFNFKCKIKFQVKCYFDKLQ